MCTGKHSRKFMSNKTLPDISSTWIRSLRSEKNQVNPLRPYAFLAEEELSSSGRLEKVNTIFLTNRECSYSCLMCDLWKNTTDEPTPRGAIPEQIEWALKQMPEARIIKLYNGANFFDPHCIPPSDYEKIASLISSYDRLIVENHPKLTGTNVFEFARSIKPSLEVAMGLESIHPLALTQLNKKMIPEDFRRAAGNLKDNGIDSRAFILLRPPFLSEEEGIHWSLETIKYAFDSGVDTCTVIPTRAGNGAMEELQANGFYHPPKISSLEIVQEEGIRLGKGRVFADTWDLQLFSKCEHCFQSRLDRIEHMNRTQEIPSPVACSCKQMG